MKKSQALFKLEEILMCDGVLDHSFGGHNALPMSYEDIAKWIMAEIERWDCVKFEKEDE